MIQIVFIALWISIFVLLCIGIKRALRQRARECRQQQLRSFRRFTREYSDRPRRRRRSHAPVGAYQPALG